MVHGRPPRTPSAAHFARRELARLLRRSPVQADFLLAGVDDDYDEFDKFDVIAEDEGKQGSRSSSSSSSSSGADRRTLPIQRSSLACDRVVTPQLFWLDRTGGCVALPYASHGPAAAMVEAAMVRVGVGGKFHD